MHSRLKHIHQAGVAALRRCGIGLVLAVLAVFGAAPQAPGQEQFTDTVMASILIASPGEAFFQVGGHCAIRLQCPAYGLDNTFSFETNSASMFRQMFGRALGRFGVAPTADYLEVFRSEGRGVMEYPLNLTDSQIRELWRLLDHAVEYRIEMPFNLRHDNCYSRAFQMVEQALRPEGVVMDCADWSDLDNGEFFCWVLERERPWACALLTTAIGADGDVKDTWRTRFCYLAAPDYFGTSTICSAEGSCRPLLAAPAAPLLVAQKSGRDNSPLTPAVVCGLLLIFVVVISAADVAGRWRRVVRVADIVLLVLETLAAVGLIVLAVIPSSIGSAWNNLMIPLNVLPALVVLFARRRRWCRWFFVVYGAVCLAFTAAPLWTSQAGVWTSLLSAAIAVRVLTHYLNKIRKN